MQIYARPEAEVSSDWIARHNGEPGIAMIILLGRCDGEPNGERTRS